ncbi:MAG: type II CRISPR RNA-guided endonuclease Cas9 [Rhodocyclaceae bacterium]|nr:type II CRISPR RNA-guided endonuclease Cas9 [Rhodocyclaceae bacterium]MCA3025475.1 type II CRISPR RNA-guided endonuclease Cas9 [Rhodocyclaceae bacterium]MCA3031990.1 type II CRISPR RNA-guided endonuclease Cas9 [Rhodocyclaceae bacterium]MCA3037657.1 type II CRISPR RNA-guided endonuclease Cas9 [Rhodocyclaceae bacterium]MCA3046869.1 type II CRISPR RNA-guided endonuclease Cas9 [Rhodocyclaceae bacterium]
MNDKKNFGPLTFGFDIGIASVGWAVLSPTRIVDLGVRCFDKAETAKEGESLNLARRSARLMRRRLRRRAWRLTKLARLLKREGLVADTKVFLLPSATQVSPWQLRKEGLDRGLSPEEWARVMYHLCKHRGFHWVSRAEAQKADGDTKGEGGKVKQGLAGTAKLMKEKGYRTAAEMVLAEFPSAQRNKRGEYTKALSRELLDNELKQLFERQREYGNPHADSNLEAKIRGSDDHKSGLFWEQKPALSGNDLLKMLGKCTFEKQEYRAPKASFTAERHVWLTRLNNLRIIVDGRTRPLADAERRMALSLPYEQVGDFTYKQLRAALVKAGLMPDSFKFASLAYPSEFQKAEGKAKDPESAALTKLAAWQELRATLKKADLESEWQQISCAALEGQPETLDEIARVLSVFKDDDEVLNELQKLGLPGGAKTENALLDIRFDKFHALSLKALRKIVPYMERGLRYDEACERAEYHHSQLHKVGEGNRKYLPPLYKSRDKDGRMVFNDELGDIPRNPVVLRSLNQARKVLNALIARYGSPSSVHIEMARELSKPFDERMKVGKEQEAYRERNEKDKQTFVAEFGIVGAAKGGEFEKWKLYREQQGKCAYSIQGIDLNRLLEPGYVEIDHALPYSRSFDDSKNNKVLVLAAENRNKGNRTPYEYLDGEHHSERWRQFVGFVESNKAYRQAKRSRLLRKDFGKEQAEEFRERNLNDTRYICRFFKNQVEQFLKLADGSESKRCVVLSGQLTAFLRARWGLLKVRDESDRHHALDAVVVAACTHRMVKRMSDYARRKELDQVAEGFVDIETGEIINPAMFQQLHEHFPDPWPHFRYEVQMRLKIDDPEQLRSDLLRLGNYAEEDVRAVRPLFVSRAPQRRNSGAAHKETIYGQPERLKAKGGVTEKVALAAVTMKDLDRLIDPYRNEKLYAAIRKRLEEFGGKADKAFAASNPLHKPDKEGNPTGPIVRTVTLVIDKLSGVPVRGGIAKNDTMLRVDVFTKAGKFHLVPVYVHHKVTGLPNRAIVAFKDEDEWTAIDDSFEFLFSLYPNDLVTITQKGKAPVRGYYASCHRGTGAFSLWAHDRASSVGKGGQIEGIGIKTALAVQKYNVDVLGTTYAAPLEQRRGLA